MIGPPKASRTEPDTVAPPSSSMMTTSRLAKSDPFNATSRAKYDSADAKRTEVVLASSSEKRPVASLETQASERSLGVPSDSGQIVAPAIGLRSRAATLPKRSLDG
jgi:hypothetical protein